MGGNALTRHDYEFLTQRWQGPKGAAYNEVFEFCRQFRYCVGMDAQGRPILTPRGIAAIKAYQAEENYKRIDCI